MLTDIELEKGRKIKAILAEGEFQASEKLVEAAGKMSKQHTSLQLRYLQTLTEVAIEKNSTILFLLPIDLVKPFLENFNAKETKKK